MINHNLLSYQRLFYYIVTLDGSWQAWFQWDQIQIEAGGRNMCCLLFASLDLIQARIQSFAKCSLASASRLHTMYDESTFFMARIKIAHILSRTQFRRRSHAVLGLCVVVISNGHCQGGIITKDQQCDEDTCEFTIIKVVIRRQEVCFWNSKIHQYKYVNPQTRMHICTKTNIQKHVRVHSNQSGD